MAMRRTQHIRPRGMDRRMDHERRRVEKPARPPVYHGAVVVNLDQIRGFDLGKGHPEGVHPEGGRVDGVAERDVPCYSCT